MSLPFAEPCLWVQPFETNGIQCESSPPPRQLVLYVTGSQDLASWGSMQPGTQSGKAKWSSLGDQYIQVFSWGCIAGYKCRQEEWHQRRGPAVCWRRGTRNLMIQSPENGNCNLYKEVVKKLEVLYLREILFFTHFSKFVETHDFACGKIFASSYEKAVLIGTNRDSSSGSNSWTLMKFSAFTQEYLQNKYQWLCPALLK